MKRKETKKTGMDTQSMISTQTSKSERRIDIAIGKKLSEDKHVGTYAYNFKSLALYVAYPKVKDEKYS